jgi:hypothetical protein
MSIFDGVRDERFAPRSKAEIDFIRDRVLDEIRANPSPPREPLGPKAQERCRNGHTDWLVKANGKRSCRPCRNARRRARRAEA